VTKRRICPVGRPNRETESYNNAQEIAIHRELSLNRSIIISSPPHKGGVLFNPSSRPTCFCFSDAINGPALGNERVNTAVSHCWSGRQARRRQNEKRRHHSPGSILRPVLVRKSELEIRVDRDDATIVMVAGHGGLIKLPSLADARFKSRIS
jgi:hypothetical protein